MDANGFQKIVIDILDNLPDQFIQYLDNVEIIIERRPTREHRRMLGLKPWQTIYGCYEGTPHTERSVAHICQPDTITLFQEPLQRDLPTQIALREQIYCTVLPELAHVFGISDRRLHDLGVY